jgi:hypothetical protein
MAKLVLFICFYIQKYFLLIVAHGLEWIGRRLFQEGIEEKKRP